MRWFRWMRQAFETLFRENEFDQELDEEMAFHVERETRANIERGMSPIDARRAAFVQFGGVERQKERVRDESAARVLADLVQDVRFGWRTLRRTPGYTTVVLITLGLGRGKLDPQEGDLVVEPAPRLAALGRIGLALLSKALELRFLDFVLRLLFTITIPLKDDVLRILHEVSRLISRKAESLRADVAASFSERVRIP